MHLTSAYTRSIVSEPMRLSLHPRLPMVLMGSLLVLLTVLAVLQYTATARLVESQRVLQENALRASATRMKSDLGALFEAILIHFEPHPTPDMDLANWLAGRVARWQETSPYAGALDAVYLITPETSGLQMHRLDVAQATLRPQPWPPSLSGWKGHIQGDMDRLDRRSDGSLWLEQQAPYVLGETPGVTFPLFRLAYSEAAAEVAFVLITLQVDYFADIVLEDLVQQHFETLAEEYVLRIVTPAGITAFQSDPDWTGDPSTPDLAVSLSWPATRVYGVSPEGEVLLLSERDEQINEERATSEARALSRLEVYHRMGSLDTAMAHVQQRQLRLLLGILLLVVFVLSLLYVLAQRARRLGEQQVAFVAGISHELRTPVAAIGALADNMRAGIVRTEAHARDYGTLMHQETRRLHEMVEQVLDYASTQADPSYVREPIDLAALVRDTVMRNADYLSTADVRLTIAPATRGCTVLGDADALALALHNVLRNAVKHGPADGVVQIDLDVVAGRRGSMVRLRIMDQGPGILPKEQERVFDPFFRGTRARNEQVHGNGLGLSLVRRIVDFHDGRVRAENVSGGGTAIVFHFPLASEAP